MTILNKSETVEVRGIEEAMEYIRTAMKQGYATIRVSKLPMSAYQIEIEDNQRRSK